MEFIIFILSIVVCIYLVLWIKALHEWCKVKKYHKYHRTDIENIYSEVSILLNKANEIDALLDSYSLITEKTLNRLSEKYREYDFVLEREKRNKELRRYFATKSKRNKSW